MPRKRPVNVGELVLKELCQRMDPATRLVTPNWRAIASKLGVSHVTLAKHIKRLKADGIVSTVTVEPSAPSNPRRTATAHPDPTWLPNASKRYLISESVDAARAASAVPQFTRPPKPPKERKARYKTTKAAMDAAADERMAERSRFIMDDFLRRLDPATRIVVANARDIVGRSNSLLSLTSFGRVVRAFKEAGLISPSPSQTSSDFHLGNKRYIVADAAANRDWLAFAREYRLKTAHPSGERNKSETTRSILGEKILDFLKPRIAPETGLAMASRVELSKELGYSPPVISSALAVLVASGRLERITGKPRRGLGRASNAYRIPATAAPQTPNPDLRTSNPEPRNPSPADLIVSGYAFTWRPDGIRVMNLQNGNSAFVIGDSLVSDSGMDAMELSTAFRHLAEHGRGALVVPSGVTRSCTSATPQRRQTSCTS